MTTARRQRGVTLVEVMIALLVFALIASASVFALRLGVDSRDQLAIADERLRTLQLAHILIKEDMAQVVDRPVRDMFGAAKPGAFVGGQITFGANTDEDEQILVEFVRGGWLNPQARDPRSALQHVKYIYRDGALWRRAYDYLDETEKSNFVERKLFGDLAGAEAEFLNGERRGELEWIDAWPVPRGSLTPPRAVAIIIERKNGERLRQLFWIGDLPGVPS